MATFRDTDQLYQVLDALFERVTRHDKMADAMVAGQFILRFTYKEPDGQVTIDLRQRPIKWTFGDTKLVPDLEMIQSADVAHQFWLGRLSVPRAVATRKVVARGSIARALKLLPALEPAYEIYADVLRDLKLTELLPPPEETATDSIQARVSRILRRVRTRLWRGGQTIDEAAIRALNDHAIPLADQAEPDAVEYRDQALPEDPDDLSRCMLARMMGIRYFEELLSEAYARGDLPTEALHLSIGQEAVAVGVCFALRADDHIATTHRGHGHMLAKGADLDGMMAELLAKASGLCGGKGGSMHVTDARVGAIGANGIVGASPLIAAGAAHSARLRGSDQVAVAFMGDGATNQGMFHEALNFAAVFDLPVVFVVENNLYGEFTPQERHMRISRISDRAAAYGMTGVTVDGNDVWAVYEATQQAVAKARKGDGPTLLECRTYRWGGHMEGESANYRSAEEIASWKERCPIDHLRTKLETDAVLSAEAAGELEEEEKEKVRAAFSAATDAASPAGDTLHTHIFAPEPRELYEGTEIPPGDRTITYSEALFEALTEELRRDPRTYLLGEDVTTGGYFAVTAGLADEFTAQRIIDTPISEYAIVGSAVGSAMTGGRPICEILFSDFLTTCMDPLVNQAAKLRYMSGGQYAMPLVVRTPGGAGLGMAAQHSQSLEAWLAGIPGLILVAPATPYDAKGLLAASIRSNNPVVFFENKMLYASTGPVPEGPYVVPLGSADVKRAGSDVTVVSVGGILGRVLDAAETAAKKGIDVEVVDVRTVVPLDMETIVRSVMKTGHLVTAEDAPRTHGFGAEIVAGVAEVAQQVLHAPPRRVAALDVPIPYDSALENAALPDAARIEAAIHAVTGQG